MTGVQTCALPIFIENAFLEAFRLLADSFDDVLQSVLNTIEDILKDDTELKRVKQLEKDISTIESKKSRLTDLLIDGKIEQEDYDEKKLSFQRKLHQITEEKAYLEENIGQQKNISKRMSQLRQTLENEKDRKSTRLNSSHRSLSRMPSSA